MTPQVETRLNAEVTFRGVKASVRCARRYVAAVLARHPDVDTAVLLTSELVTNAVLHSRSRRPGGRVVLTVVEHADAIRLEVIDDGTDERTPHLADTDPSAENGRGLRIVKDLALRYGSERRGVKRVMWFELPPLPGRSQ